MAKARLILDTRKVSKSKITGLYPIAIRVYHLKPRIIRLSHHSSISGWNKKEQCLRNSFKLNGHLNPEEVNKEIYEKLDAAKKTIYELGASLKNISPDNLVIEIKKKWEVDNNSEIKKKYKDCITLEQIGKIVIERKLKANKAGTAKWYKDAIRAFIKFNNDKDLNLGQIDLTLLKDFEAEHLAKGNSKNGIGAYVRAIRALYNSAINEDLFEPAKNPFMKYKIPKSTYTKKKAVPKEKFVAIRKLKYPYKSAIWHVKNYALVMFNCRGLNLIDLAKLRVNSIEGNRIFYGRSKTGDSLSVEITEELAQILQHYLVGKKNEDFIFPIGYDGGVENNALYRARRKIVNKYFKRIAEDAGIEEKFTTYYIRHSWATIAKDMGISIEVISEGLGHSSFKTTQVYLKSFNNKTLDEANSMVVN
jgi:site-specific recombinase XerD